MREPGWARPLTRGGPRAARSAWVVLALLVALLALTGGAWYLVGGGGRTQLDSQARSSPAAPDSGARPEAPAMALADPAAEPGEARSPTRSGATEPAPAAALPALAEFRGRGSIRGELVVPRGLELPETWTVVVGPSRSVRGRERAETRRIERPGDRRDFVVEDLPLAGYDVRVEGPGLGCYPVPVLLVRGSQHAFVNVAVHRSGFLDGFLHDEQGRPVEDLLVVLEDVHSKERRTTRSGANGSYVMYDLADSEYRIYFGGVTHPLLPPAELSFRSPSMRYPTRTLPALGTLVIHTTDPHGSPIGHVSVHGYSPEGGTIELVTDAHGQGRATNLRPGRYRIAAHGTDPPREGRLSFDVEGGYEDEVRIPLVPRD